MRALFIFCLFIFSVPVVNAQEIDVDRALKHLEFLSSDSLDGRKTGTEGSEIARNYIIDEFKKYGLSAYFPDYIHHFTYVNKEDTITGTNIVGFVEGEIEAAIVISAHYDHIGSKGKVIFNGADDNASGVGALLEIASYFLEHKPIHTLVFCAFDAEEYGLQGSKAFLESSAVNPMEYALNINMDMVSRSKKGILFAVGTAHFPYFKDLLPLGKQENYLLATGHDNSSNRKTDWTFSSDHSSFFQHNIPFIYFGVEDHEDYHKATDTFEKIDPQFYQFSIDIILKSILSIDQELSKGDEEEE